MECPERREGGGDVTVRGIRRDPASRAYLPSCLRQLWENDPQFCPNDLNHVHHSADADDKVFLMLCFSLEI